MFTVTALDPQTRLFVFKSENSSLPLGMDEEICFYTDAVITKYPDKGLLSQEDARKNGFLIADYFLKIPRINDVMLSLGPTGENIIAVTLQNGFTWTDPLEAQPPRAFFTRGVKSIAKTFETSVKERLMKEYGVTGRPIYRDPAKVTDTVNVVDIVNAYINSPKDPKDPNAAVHITMRGDKGGSRALSFDAKTGELIMAFDGACKSECVKGDTSFTEAAMVASIRSNIPEVQSIRFI